MLHMKAKI